MTFPTASLPSSKWLLLSLSVQSHSRPSLAIMIVRASTRYLVSIFQGSHHIRYVHFTHYIVGAAQMSLLQNLPSSLCEPGPKEIDGVGNFYLEVLAPEPPELMAKTVVTHRGLVK
ncbi:hypothetical protein F5883DRAFT_21587 [Diaporthe sp. PMI_573]|nr:hypothetical protein F5883DRAFT_21587 [Diaporthaceae sp. PMI_573]